MEEPPSRSPRREVEFKLSVEGEAAFRALLRVLPGAPRELPEATLQENQYFDAEGRLVSARIALRLRLEGGSASLTAKGPRPSESAEVDWAERPEEEVRVGPEVAAAIRAGSVCPLAVLEDRISGSELLANARRLVGPGPLTLVDGFRNWRRRVGPVALEHDGVRWELVFELDRTELPGGRVDHEVEVEVPAEDAPRIRPAIEALFARAGLPWRPATNKLARFRAALEEGS